jgi:hypothetical protein
VSDARWTGASDVRARIQREWDRGRVLASAALSDDMFPLRIALRRPTSPELSTNFDDARSWIVALRSIAHTRVDFRDVNHQQLGANQVPSALWIDTIDDAAALIGKTRQLRQFQQLVVMTELRRPALVPLLARRSLDVLDVADAWPRLLDIVDWMVDNPRPGIYLRQVDVLGVHTKFIELHQRLLAAMLEVVLPDWAIDVAARPSDFARRFGFRERPRLVRFRYLDARLALTTTDCDRHYALTAADFGRVAPAGRVFITENEINFLAFPAFDDAMVVFGAGSGFDHFALVPWLGEVAVHYWGDIDTHGMAILDQLRAVAPHATSLMMDRDTLLAHRDYWGVEDKPTRRDLQRLTPTEQALYDDLRDNRIRPNLRLEQERIRFGWVRRAVADVS